MPVIPYTLRGACLWREFGLRATLSAHRTKRHMKRSRVITLAIVVAVIALFFYMSTARANQECMVCVDFQGQSKDLAQKIFRTRDGIGVSSSNARTVTPCWIEIGGEIVHVSADELKRFGRMLHEAQGKLLGPVVLQ